jgi:flagellar hook protein FlgE
MAISNSLNSGVTGVKAFSKSLEVIGDNIANVNSTGFKRSRVTNKDSFSQTYEQSTAGVAGGANGSNSMQIGSGTSVASISQTFNQGVLSNTGGPTDLGISGKGFFEVKNPSTGEKLYTRAGDFILDNVGNLLTNDGYNVQGVTTGLTNTSTIPLTTTTLTSGNIQILPTITSGTETYTLQSYIIQDDGQIKATYSGVTTSTGKASPTPFQTVSVGQIILANFSNPNALERAGNNLLKSNAAAGLQPTLPTTAPANGAFYPQTSQIIQGTLELSNVDLTQEFSDIIVAQRAFQANSRVITVSDSVLEEVVNLKR